MRRALAVLFLLACAGRAADMAHTYIGNPTMLIGNTTPTPTVVAMNSAAIWVGFVFQANSAATVTQFKFLVGTHTGTPTQYRVSFQGVSASTGNPDGVITASALFSSSTGDSTLKTLAITRDGSGGALSSVAFTRGQIVAMVIEPCPNTTLPCTSATAPDASNFWNVVKYYTGTNYTGRATLPYPVTSANTGSTWTHEVETPVYGYADATTSYGFPIQKFNAVTGVSSGAEQAVAFNLPTTWCKTVRIAGIQAVIQTAAASKNTKIALYSGTTVISSFTWDSDISVNNSGSYRPVQLWFTDSTLPTLNCGTTYRIGFSPQDASNAVGLETMTVAAVGDFAPIPGGTNFWSSTRTGCGAACDTTATAWTDVTTDRPLLALIVDDWTTAGEMSSTFVQ